MPLLEQVDLFAEQWRPIPSAPGYEASNRGRIRRASSGRGAMLGHVLAQHPGGGPSRGPDGERTPGKYLRVRTSVDGRARTRLVHILVAEAWVPGRRPGFHVDHIDRDYENNRPENLRWVPGGFNSHRANMGRWHDADPDPYAWGRGD